MQSIWSVFVYCLVSAVCCWRVETKYVIPEILRDIVEPPLGDDSATKQRYDWFAAGQEELSDVLGLELNKDRVAKNVILFVGDGLGVSTVTAARILKAQTSGVYGQEGLLAMERLPYTALARTHCVNLQTPDSACTATALLSGVKARALTIGVNHRTISKNCSTVSGNEAKTILEYAHDAGKWTGVVTTARLTHGTPAGAYAHTAHRDWETGVPEGAEDCKDIARQLVEDREYIRVLLGGGRRAFYPNDEPDPEYTNKNGTRLDGRNLIQEWLDHKKNAGVEKGRYHYVWNKAQFDHIDPNEVDYLLGSFEPSHMQFEQVRERVDGAGEPSLAGMTQKAIRILQHRKQGYFLFVEGARIDHAHHGNSAYHALHETLSMDAAVQHAVDLTDPKDTLIVVTSDHSHTLTISGYSSANQNILGLADLPINPTQDGLPRTILGYANGPSYNVHRPDPTTKDRINLTDIDTTSPTFYQDAALPTTVETHSGEDVPVYASGPMAHLFTGSHEQSYIAHAIMYASCLGPNKDHCIKNQEKEKDPKPLTCAANFLQTHLYQIWTIVLSIYLVVGY